jgi:hypothetical protein
MTSTLFIAPVLTGCIVDLRGCIMVIMTSLACACVGVGYHACEHDPWCNLTFVHHHTALGYLDLYTTRLLFVSLFMRVCQAFDMCSRDVGMCGFNVIIKSMAWSALNGIIIMTTVATDELPGEMDYHVFVALSVTIMVVLGLAPNAANRVNWWPVAVTFGMFMLGIWFYFEAERVNSKYQLYHSLWHGCFASSATASVFAINHTRSIVRRDIPSKTAGSL